MADLRGRKVYSEIDRPRPERQATAGDRAAMLVDPPENPNRSERRLLKEAQTKQGGALRWVKATMVQRNPRHRKRAFRGSAEYPPIVALNHPRTGKSDASHKSSTGK
jgi:hypothetical protein